MASVQLWPLIAPVVKTGGVAQVAIYGPISSGSILNPATAADQGIPEIENLYIDLVGPASLSSSSTTVAIPPGGTFNLPAGFTGQASVAAGTAGHKFSGWVGQPQTVFAPATGPFPPPGPTTLTKVLPSYLYQEYSDDDDLQAFVAAFNQLAQEYVTWCATVGLPVYIGPLIVGGLLDLVGSGIYGLARPALPSGQTPNIGPLNTFNLNDVVLDYQQISEPSNFYLTTDDVYKRVLTWHLYKGDGKVFDVKWLKRRVLRFLLGEDGADADLGDTSPVSVTFGLNDQININLQTIRRYATGGSLLDSGTLDGFLLDDLTTATVSLPISPLVPIFQAAVAAGVLELPFQYSFIVNVD